MRIVLSFFLIVLIALLLLNPIYYIGHRVEAISANQNYVDLPYISVQGGVKNYSILTLGFKRKELNVRGWGFSGIISANKLSKVKSVRLFAENSNCFKARDERLTLDFNVISQQQVGKVLDFQIPVDFYLNCDATMHIVVHEEQTNEVHELKYKVRPRVQHGIRREWAK